MSKPMVALRLDNHQSQSHMALIIISFWSPQSPTQVAALVPDHIVAESFIRKRYVRSTSCLLGAVCQRRVVIKNISLHRGVMKFFSGKICLVIQNSRTRNANLEIFSAQVKQPGDAISCHLGAFGSQKFSCTLRANLWWRSA